MKIFKGLVTLSNTISLRITPDIQGKIYPGRFGLPHSDAPGSRFDAEGEMVQIEETNVVIALATARPMECFQHNAAAIIPQGEAW